MTKDERNKSKELGYCFPGSVLYGGENQQLRVLIMQEYGAVHHDGNWVFSTMEDMQAAKAHIKGETPAASAQPTQLEAPPMPTSVPQAPEASEPKPAEPKPAEPKSAESKPVLVDPLPEMTDFTTLKLKPCRFVVVRTKIYSPNVRRELERNRKEDNDSYGVESVVIRTVAEHTIINPKEYDVAKTLRGSVSSELRKLGTRVVDGMYSIPLDGEAEWDKARKAQKERVQVFNRTSTHHKLVVDAIKLEAMVGEEELMARKVTYEIQRIFDEMTAALASYDPEAIRQSATEAKYKAQSLAPSLERGALEAAVINARDVANKISSDVRDKGELMAETKAKLSTEAVGSARMMFIKMAIPEEIGDANSGRSARIAKIKPVVLDDIPDAKTGNSNRFATKQA